MAHFAHITSGVVDNVIVIDAETLALGHWGDPSEWVQTSYNTQGGVHTQGGNPLHKNYAGMGYTWDGTGFAPPQPFASWTKNVDTYLWEAPVAMPSDSGTGTPPKRYTWNEETVNWVEFVVVTSNTETDSNTTSESNTESNTDNTSNTTSESNTESNTDNTTSETNTTPQV